MKVMGPNYSEVMNQNLKSEKPQQHRIHLLVTKKLLKLILKNAENVFLASLLGVSRFST